MLLDYQKKNLEKLSGIINDCEHISIVGKYKSGRKTVVTHLCSKQTVIINVTPNKDKVNLYGDILSAVKDIKHFRKARKKVGLDLSIGGEILGVSANFSSYELYALEKELVNRIIKLSQFKRVVFVVDSPTEVEAGSIRVITQVCEKNRSRLFRHKIIRIDICKCETEACGKVVFFESQSCNTELFRKALGDLNLNPNVFLSSYILDFISKNADGNIELIKQIVADINEHNIDAEFTTTDRNSRIRNLIDFALENNANKKEIENILTIMSLCDRYFSELDLSFLLEKELNIVELYLEYAMNHNLLGTSENGYQIVLGIIRIIFSSLPLEKKREVYNRIIDLIDCYYPDQYFEKYTLAKIANQQGHSTFLLQHIMKEIRETGVYYCNSELTNQDRAIVERYYDAYCKANNHQYKEAALTLSNAIIELTVVSPLLQEYQLVMSQFLIKSIQVVDRNEAIGLLAYDLSDSKIDEYLRYRLETRRIAALIHNGEYKRAREQSQITINRLITSVQKTKSPGSEYYLNVIYRKYCNIHPYESSLAAINQSVNFFSHNPKYLRAHYIALCNKLALELINGDTENALLTGDIITSMKVEHYSTKFPRPEILENNMLVSELVSSEFAVSSTMINRWCVLKKTTSSADKILITSNLAIAYAIAGDMERAVDLLSTEYERLDATRDHEGIYMFRIACNLAVLRFIQNNATKASSLALLNSVYLSDEDPHYSDRRQEHSLLIKTMEQIGSCKTAEEWMSAYQERVDSPRNYYRLFERGFVFTTLFDWDDE